jgi:DNA-binding NtrC family response regulator
VLAATNRDLPGAIRDGHFRKDLYYRLNVVGIQVAPLRERRADVPELAARFVRALCADLGLPSKVLSPGAREALAGETWPGNVRQLRNTLERAVITSRDGRIDDADLAADVSCAPEPPAIGSAPAGESGAFSLAAAEREVVLRALDRAGYVQKEAARLMGVSRRKLNYMIQRMGVTHPSWRRNRGPRAGVEEAGSGAVLQSRPSDVY